MLQQISSVLGLPQSLTSSSLGWLWLASQEKQTIHVLGVWSLFLLRKGVRVCVCVSKPSSPGGEGGGFDTWHPRETFPSLLSKK